MRNPAVIFFSVVFILCARAIEPEVPAGGERITVPESLNAYADPAHGKAARLDHNTWHIQVDRADEARPFLAQVSAPCPASALAPGDVVLAIIRARANPGTIGAIEAKLQLADAPYTPAADSVPLELGPQWRDFPVIFRVTQAVEKGRAAVVLLCAGKAQSISIVSIHAYKYPPRTDTSKFPRIRRTYAGREADAPWRKAALDRIEKHRKANLSVRVLGPDGKPLANTKVTLKLRRHEFGFGSAVTAELLTADTEDGRRYREIVDRYFSRVVFEDDLKDFGWEPGASGKEDRLKKLDQAIGWLGQRHISIRGHYLMQVATPPNLAEVTDPEAIRNHFITTAKERIAFAKDRVCEWDVINHPVAWKGADLLSKRPGLEKLDREIYRLAEKETSLPFYVNEDQIFHPGHQSDGTFAYIQQLKKEGLRVDGLGNQAHVDDSYLPTPEHVLTVTDHFASLVPRQVITEFDIVTQNDEELAADYTRDLLIACFSHPAYTGFLFWGFWEGRHWKPEAASWTTDWSIRKRGEVIEEWLGRRWTTNVTLTTDKNGSIQWRGFPGWYDLKGIDQIPATAFSVTKAAPSSEVKINRGK